MSRFVSIRGWIETYFEMSGEFESVVNSYELKYQKYFLKQEQVNLYQKGWKFPDQCINGISYIFYGATIKLEAEEYIKDQILDMLRLDDGDKDIQGLFYINDDEGEYSIIWEIIDSQIIVKSRTTS